MITLASRPHEDGWVRQMRATDEQLDAYLTPPPAPHAHAEADDANPSRDG